MLVPEALENFVHPCQCTGKSPTTIMGSRCKLGSVLGLMAERQLFRPHMSICLMSLGLEADGLLDSQGEGWWPSHRATCHRLTDCHKEGGNGPFLPCATSRGGVRNVSGTGVVGEYISSQLAFWKRNDLIRQASLQLHGKTRQRGLGERPTEGPGLCLGQGCPVPSTSCPALGTAEPFESSCSSESSTL